MLPCESVEGRPSDRIMRTGCKYLVVPGSQCRRSFIFQPGMRYSFGHRGIHKSMSELTRASAVFRASSYRHGGTQLRYTDSFVTGDACRNSPMILPVSSDDPASHSTISSASRALFRNLIIVVKSF